MDTSQYFYFRTQKRRTFKFSFKISLAEIFGFANWYIFPGQTLDRLVAIGRNVEKSDFI